MSECEKSVAKLYDDLSSGAVDYIAFLSCNAFTYLVEAASGLDIVKQLKTVPIISVGQKTAEFLESNGLKPSIIAAQPGYAGIVDSMKPSAIHGKRIVVIRNASAKNSMSSALLSAGALDVIEIGTYETRTILDAKASRAFYEALSSRSIDAIIFGSGLGAEGMMEMLGIAPFSPKQASLLSGVLLAAIGASTARTMASIGMVAEVVPDKCTFDDLVIALDARLGAGRPTMSDSHCDMVNPTSK
jgi:uroporphyrinogen-III synthase